MPGRNRLARRSGPASNRRRAAAWPDCGTRCTSIWREMRSIRPLYQWLLAGTLALSTILALGRGVPGAAPAAETVVFDLGRAHGFSGFGVQDWPTEKHKTVRGQIYR